MPDARRALVVGATTSIGHIILQSLAMAGMHVLATGRALPTADTAQLLIEHATLDLLNSDSLDRFACEVVPAFGKLDVVLFLAGILPGKSLADYDDALMQEVMTVNFTAHAALLRRLLPHFGRGAQVLLVSSISAERGSFDPIYAASKAAQIAFVKSLATWLAPDIRVNAIAPGLIENSSMYKAMAPERRAHHLTQSPTRRLTTMQEIAGVIVDLCGPAWSNLNGQVIRINGGAHV